jgi:hypothetical protein
MDTLGMLLMVIAVLLLASIVLALLGFLGLELRWIVRVWTRDADDPWR